MKAIASEQTYQIAKRISLLCGTFLVLSTTIGVLNKRYIADPIVRAVSDERLARQSADSLTAATLQSIQNGQGDLARAIAEATYSKAEIDKFRADADREHAKLQAQIDQLRLLIGPRKMPDLE